MLNTEREWNRNAWLLKSVRRKNTSDSTCRGMCCVHSRQAESVDVSLRENYRGSGLSVSAKSALASLVEETS